MVNTKILFATAAVLAMFAATAEAKLYKWVDADGRVHYESTMQPEAAGQHPVEIEKGREVKKQEKADKRLETKETPEQVEQRHHDEALLNSFSSEAEIDLARDRNLQQVNAHLSGIDMRINSAKDDLAALQKEQADRAKAKKPADPVLEGQIGAASARLAKLQDERAKTEAEAAKIRERYDSDKQRFRELKGGQAK